MEMRAWVERLMGLGPEWRIEWMDEDSERQEARVVLARKAGSALPSSEPPCPSPWPLRFHASPPHQAKSHL